MITPVLDSACRHKLKTYTNILFAWVLIITVYGNNGYAETEQNTKNTASMSNCSGVLGHSLRLLNSQTELRPCDTYAGKLFLVVNTASECVYTPQYIGLQTLYQRYKDEGLVVMGFPSNDFANQEPGSEQQVYDFCINTKNIEFPMFAKTRVLKNNADLFYRDLGEAAGRYPSWNFHKYLVNSDGQVIADFPSHVEPLSQQITRKIEANL